MSDKIDYMLNDFGARLTEAFKDSENLKDDYKTVQKSLNRWANELGSLKNIIDKMEGEMYVLMSIGQESNEVLDSLRHGLVNGLTIWQNRKFLKAMDDVGIKNTLEVAHSKALLAALKSTDDETRQKIKMVLDEVLAEGNQ